MKNHTPKTDAHLAALQKDGAYADATAVSADFARELEREAERLRGLLKEAREQIMPPTLAAWSTDLLARIDSELSA